MLVAFKSVAVLRGFHLFEAAVGSIVEGATLLIGETWNNAKHTDEAEFIDHVSDFKRQI